MEQLKLALSWLGDNWVVLTVLVGVLVQVLQVITKHWGSYKGIARVSLFLIELLSVFRSKDVEGVVKLPLTSKSEPKKPITNDNKGNQQ